VEGGKGIDVVIGFGGRGVRRKLAGGRDYLGAGRVFVPARGRESAPLKMAGT
jgi:hypothetical protein